MIKPKTKENGRFFKQFDRLKKSKRERKRERERGRHRERQKKRESR